MATPTSTKLESTRLVDSAKDDLQALFDAQKTAFKQNTYPSFKERIASLQALAKP